MFEVRTSKIIRIIPILITILLLSISAQAKYSGGTGEPNNPFQIAEPNDWVELMNVSDDWNKYFIMTSDIDLNGISLTPVGTNSSKSFKGIFDGNDHIIYSADVNKPNNNYIGLFGYVSSGGQIHNLGLINVKIIGYNCIGGLVGMNFGGNVNCCYSSGMINGAFDTSYYVGGLVGINVGDINHCYSTALVKGYQSVGGLVGSNTKGESNGTINFCYSTCTVIGIAGVGGLVGTNINTVNFCYSTSTVSGDYIVGGLTGSNKSKITYCYSTGAVSGNNSIGGLAGYNYLGDVNNCFWDVQTSGQTWSAGGTGKTTIEMKDPNTFISKGWDFIGETVNGPNDIWWILDGKDYPRLWWQLPEDDFNDCNAAPLWLAYETEPDLAHLEEINGRLEVNTAGAMDSIDAIYIPYNWALDANKPFAVQVDFHFSKIGIGDGRINLGIVPSLDPYAMKWAEFEAGTFDDNPFYLYEIRDGMWVEEQTCARLLDDGTLYVSYDPNSDELYLSNKNYGKADAVWTVTGLIRGQWQCDSLYFFLSGGSEGGMALTGEDAWLDNFKVDEGVIWQ